MTTALRYMSPKNAGHWGDWMVEMKSGYVRRQRWIPETKKLEYQLQHRFVMEEHLGRKLSRKESVHHINGIRSDNRIENLQLRQGAHGRGVRMICLDCGSHNVTHVELD